MYSEMSILRNLMVSWSPKINSYYGEFRKIELNIFGSNLVWSQTCLVEPNILLIESSIEVSL